MFAGSNPAPLILPFAGPLSPFDSRAVNLITRSPLRRAGMPFKFWKKEEKKPSPPPPAKPAATPAARAAAKPAAKPADKPAPPAPPRRTPEDIALEIHKGLVEAGLTIDGTREVFKKRVTEKVGSL